MGYLWTPVARGAAAAMILISTAAAAAAEGPRHYVFFSFDRHRIAEPAFLETPGFEGAQLRYAWRELEPEKDRYDFSAIEHDLNLLEQAGKRLFVQIQDVSFQTKYIHAPEYLRDDAYNGGICPQYMLTNEDDATAKQEGWMIRRWDPLVQARLHALFDALGARFDGRIEGINLCETAAEFGSSGSLFPEGYTHERYRDAIIENMAALKAAFPKSVVIQYANFMPGDWSTFDDAESLTAVFAAAGRLGVGVGGPDIKVNRKWQMRNSYPLIREAAGKVPTGVAVQWGNYEEVDPESGKQVTVASIYGFARDYLKLDYIFWETQPPYYREGVLPFVRSGA